MWPIEANFLNSTVLQCDLINIGITMVVISTYTVNDFLNTEILPCAIPLTSKRIHRMKSLRRQDALSYVVSEITIMLLRHLEFAIKTTSFYGTTTPRVWDSGHIVISNNNRKQCSKQ